VQHHTPNQQIQSTVFASVLYEPADVAEIRLLPPATSSWHRAGELEHITPQLVKANREGANVFIGINPRRAHGARRDEGVLACRVLAADYDHTSIEDANKKREWASMPATTLSVWSGHGVHHYWRLAEPLEPKLWREWQKDLAALVGSDPAVHNPERIMRLPGFLNLKKQPTPAYIIEHDASRVYDLADLPIPMRARSDNLAPAFRLRRHRDDAEHGDRVRRCRDYMSKIPAAIAGEHGHKATWYAANTCVRFGLTKGEALELMQWYSDTRCTPPWTAKEITHKVDDAYRRNAHQHGQKLQEERANYEHGRNSGVFKMRRGAA